MYPDPKFQVQDPETIRAFVNRHPLATLVISQGERYAATHLPLLVQEWGERKVFRGHVMRDTDHWRALACGAPVFASFLGPDAPILGSWQLTPRFGGSWNYQAVHVQGRVHAQDNHTLRQHLQTLKDRFETSPEHRFDSLPADYLDALMPLIVCIDIEVIELSAIFKLSQNRRLEEFDRTHEQLARLGGKSALVAEEMRARRSMYFPTAESS